MCLSVIFYCLFQVALDIRGVYGRRLLNFESYFQIVSYMYVVTRLMVRTYVCRSSFLPILTSVPQGGI